MVLKYNLDNKILNNDLYKFLRLKNYNYDYVKDYQGRNRYIIFYNKIDNINMFFREFNIFVYNKRKNKNWYYDFCVINDNFIRVLLINKY